MRKAFTVLALAVFLVGCGDYYQGQPSNHYDGQHFFNPGKPMPHGLWRVIRWRLLGKREVWPTYVSVKATAKPAAKIYGNQLRLFFVGHDTVLIQTQGLNILTDPIWSERASPFSWIGPKRVTIPGINFADLPKIDLVLISHNHYDHMDLASIQHLWQRDKPRIIVPLGNDSIIKNYDPAIKVEAYDWNDKININAATQVYLLPTQHWSARGLYDVNKALWTAYVIQTPSGNIYFAGDAGYGNGDDFVLAQKKFQHFRLALLPIGAYEPRWFMEYSHTNPEEAVQAYLKLNAQYALGVHFGTFHLTDEGYYQPFEDLANAEKKHHISSEHFRALEIGQAWNVPF